MADPHASSRPAVSGRRPPAATAAEGWRHLSDVGGIEPNGRDADTVALLAGRLDPVGSNIDRGLASATVGSFLRAFFEVVSPFAEMSRDILEFFSEAGATHGRDQWRLRLGDDDLDLAELEQFIEEVEAGVEWIEHAALDFDAAWSALTKVEAAVGTGPLSVGWGEWAPPEPPSSPPPAIDRSALPALADFADCVTVMSDIVEGLGEMSASGPPRMMAFHRLSERLGFDRDDAFARGTLAGMETDHYLVRAFDALGALASLPSGRAADLDRTLSAVLSPLPRRRSVLEVAQASLERILSLPVWSKRYEMYAVWVATELRRAMRDHPFSINHRDGVMNFPFAETILATVGTAAGDVELVLERRVQLAQPLGKGRTGNVQPDYSAWTADERCPLVVEVKHYKRAAPASFSDVLVDYARAHPDASVVLVNYGPVGSVLDRVKEKASEVSGRCAAIGGLAPAAREARAAFAAIVRPAFGPPPLPSGAVSVVVDVSLSMMNLGSGGRTAVRDWLVRPANAGMAHVILVDDGEVTRGTAAEMAEVIRHRRFERGTDLAPSIARFLADAPRLLVLADEDGVGQLSDLGAVPTLVERLGRTIVLVEVVAPG